MKKTKKLISLLLAAIMVLSVFSVSASAANREFESNNSYETANILEKNGSISGTMASKSDVDYYKVCPDSNGKLTVNFKHLYNSDSYVYWTIYLLMYVDGSYSELSSRIIYGYDTESIDFPFIGASKGITYYIKVSTYRDVTVGKEYTLTTSFISSEYYEKEVHNGSYASANDFVIGKSYNPYSASEKQMNLNL